MTILIKNIYSIETSPSIVKATKQPQINPLLAKFYDKFAELDNLLKNQVYRHDRKRKYVTDAEVDQAIPQKKSRGEEEEKKPIVPGSTTNLLKAFDPFPPNTPFVSRLVGPELVTFGQLQTLQNLDQTLETLQTVLPNMDSDATRLLASVLLLKPQEFALLRGTSAASETISKSYGLFKSPFLKMRTEQDFPAVAALRKDELAPRR